jgi:lysophospholipase
LTNVCIKKNRGLRTNDVIVKLIFLFSGLLFMIQTNCMAKEQTFSPYGFIATLDHQSLRYGIWYSPKEKSKGSILLLNGRREFMEKYLETIGELNREGFNVYSFDWRGQGLSSRMLANRHKGFIDDYDVYLSDLNMFVTKIVTPESVHPLIIIAHSMGGHIALRFIHDHPDVAEMAVLTSPMIDIFRSSLSRGFVKLITGIAIKTGFSHSYAIGSGDYTDEEFEGNELTSDPVRFTDAKKAIEKNPGLALGGATYGWLSATLKSTDILTQPGFAAKISTPILMVIAGNDKIVSTKAQKKICTMLPNCKLIEISGARHEIFKETNAVRSIFWREFNRFTHAE